MRSVFLLFLLVSSALAQKSDLRHGVTVTALAFSPDGRTLASGGQDQTIRLWNLSSKEARELRGHTASITSLSYSTDGKRLASGSRDGSAIIWDAVSGKPLRRLVGHERTVLGVSFAPDGRWLATASYDQTIRLWDTATGNRLSTSEAHADAVSCITFAPDGRTLASGGHDNFVRVWNLAADGRSMKLRFAVRDGRRAEVTGLGFCMGGRLLASATPHGRIRLREPDQGEELRFTGVEDVTVLTLACSSDGRTLAIAGLGGYFGLCETATGQQISRHEESAVQTNYLKFTPTEGYNGEVRAIALSATGLMAAIGTKGGEVLVRDIGASLLGRNVPAKLTEQDLEKCWTDLREQDPSLGYRAAALLAARPEESLPFLQKRLLPIEKPNTAHIGKLIEQLDHPRFTMREKAAAELEKVLEVAEPLLRKRQKEGPPLELRKRIDRLLFPLDERVPPPDRLRAGRALQALERVGSPAARQILEGLASGCPGAWLTEESRLALARLRHTAP